VPSPLCDAAIGYLAIGLASIPACVPDARSPSGCNAPWHAARRDHKPGKAPMVKWAEFQQRLPTEAEWERWDREFHGRFNVGFVTGAASRTLVLDLDSPAHTDDGRGPDGRRSVESSGLVVPVSPTVVTPSGGLQVHFAYPAGVEPGSLRNFAGRLPGVDARGDGGFALLPPSATAKGSYRWANNLSRDEADLAPAPDWLLALFSGACSRPLIGVPDKPDDPVQRFSPLRSEGADPPDEPPDEPDDPEVATLWSRPCPQGCRNSACARLAGQLAAYGLPEGVAVQILSIWSAVRCLPPLDPEEVMATVRSIYRSQARHDPTAGIFPAPEDEAAAAFDQLPLPTARMLASDDPATRCGGAARALRFGMSPSCVLTCLLAMNGGNQADARRALRWAMRVAEVKGRAS
jgi:hypothetical protein